MPQSTGTRPSRSTRHQKNPRPPGNRLDVGVSLTKFLLPSYHIAYTPYIGEAEKNGFRRFIVFLFTFFISFSFLFMYTTFLFIVCFLFGPRLTEYRPLGRTYAFWSGEVYSLRHEQLVSNPYSYALEYRSS